MTFVNVVISGDARSKLQRLSMVLAPGSIGVFLGEVVDSYLIKRARDRFQGEGDDVVGRWAPLTEATQAIRQQAGYGSAHPINVRTGDLESLIIDAPQRLEIDPMGATLTRPGNTPVGELRQKLIHAQEGGTGPSGSKFPARPVLGMNERDTAFVLTELESYIRAGVGE